MKWIQGLQHRLSVGVKLFEQVSDERTTYNGMQIYHDQCLNCHIFRLYMITSESWL